mgnify:CR=1 FL=1|tara:strand:- start:181 stop:462 length:282 start_codon:yes stop_codon:yes gene_type:complete
MTKYQQTANPNATNSELDAKQIVSTTIPDCDLPVSLTEGQISTILYVLEGYIQGSDEYHFNDDFTRDVDNIFQRLETVVDSHYDRLEELCKEI